MQFKPVQTYLAKRAAKYLSGELHTKINIKSLYLKPFKSLVLEDLYVQDLQKDTLLYAPRLTVDLNLLSIKLRKISVNTVQLDNGQFYLKDFKDSSNLGFIINYFSSGKPEVKKKGKPYDITFDKIVLNDFGFKYKNFNNPDTTITGVVNFDDVDLKKLNGTFLNLDTKNHLAKFQVRHLTFREKSGFYLKNLTTLASIDTNSMEFKNLLLETPKTKLTDYVSFKFNKYKDFSRFVSKVYVKGVFKNSLLHPADISFFAPEVQPYKVDFHIDGRINGYVNNFKARSFAVRAGNATYLKGDFDITGLPKLSETFLDLKFDQIASNHRDADEIIRALTGKKTSQVPQFFQKFGNINFKGRFTGFPKDFIAFGEFKTGLGRIVTDVNMKLLATPVYSGTVKTYDFDFGKLADEPLLGRGTLSARIKGRGFSQKTLNSQINTTASYFTFKGYTYHNIDLNGKFNKNRFDGNVKINDNNLVLDFDGGVDLNPALPEFNFTSSIKNANLKNLNLTKDTLAVDAELTTNFTGNDLNNLQGNLLINRVRITTPKNSFIVDSVYLDANGIGANRELHVNSDILEASIKGEYDLNTLPSYFKSVAKRYVPSLQTTIVKGGVQNFNFNLQIKYFEPLSALFAPDLKLPEGALLTGVFKSQENLTNFNASSNLIQYKKIKVNNFILDESNNEQALNVFISSDRVDLTDSLFIKNVNIANVLKNDSLNLNVKLSDKSATNQLDLNGLAEFKADSSMKLSILPSDVVINNNEWKITDKVKIGFDRNKINIAGFELSRNDQSVTINGIISEDPKDHIDLLFENFQLANLNTLTNAAGVLIKGKLNGSIGVTALSKTPHIETDLRGDSVVVNSTAIGNFTIKADFDNETKLVNAKANIQNKGFETLDIEGTYNARPDENTLNLQVRMDKSEIVIFEPFIKDLVSNLSGTVSADLTVTGKATDPQIDGTLSLNNAGMTVNFLKTAYHINDRVKVENSKIFLENLILRDVRNHEAIANGSVDMKDPNNPTIDVNLTAQNFMALNTTRKDNQLYYGVAYATGVFSFKGPTDNINIDIDAKTEDGTVFNIPLNSAETVSDKDFITFIKKDSNFVAKKESSFKGVNMNFILNVDNKTEVNIFTEVGKLTGRGDAQINLKITSMGDFEMYGDYLISTGKFEFTAQDFINKIFEIDRGGSVRWTGNPTDAKINVNATYAVRASLGPLYTAANIPAQSNANQRVLSEAIMTLTGSLLRPDITFNLDFPSDSYVKDELQAYLSDQGNVTQQAVSLILRRSFAPGSGTDITQQLNSTVQSAATELFFNQFNNVLAQSLNLKFVDLNIRSFNEASASIRLLNDRLVLTGGVTDTRANIGDFNVIGSAVAHDVEASYLIKKDGSLSIRASNRLNNRNFLNPVEEYVNAIGIVYRQEFDNFGEFLKIIIGQKRREERRKHLEEEQKKKPDPATTEKPVAIKPADAKAIDKKIVPTAN
ncbi:translocation/assembly module TamB [Pedobacter sp. HMF7647]|uniref:Translocation/assembly module TamB n=1 Tax=Hufsiella arboris TaxID=2695275 RepID=A0A7K1Y883_9SPHI|nr:translocation/assembly module TamB [Hufsiella arboris]